MNKSLTLKINDALLYEARHLSVDADKSLSAWVSELIASAVIKHKKRRRSNQRILESFDKYAFDFGPNFKFDRDSVNEERLSKWLK